MKVLGFDLRLISDTSHVKEKIEHAEEGSVSSKTVIVLLHDQRLKGLIIL